MHAVEWTRTYGGTGDDEPKESSSLVQTGDGGYAIAGVTHSFGVGGLDFYVIRTDGCGNVLWNETFGGPSDDEAWSIIQTSDEGFAVAGFTKSFGAGKEDAWLVKIDSSGNLQWNQTYGRTETDKAKSVVQTNDGGYAIGGHTFSFGAGDADFWLFKMDSAGRLNWSQTYDGVGADRCTCIVQTSDGGFAVAGVTESFGAGQEDSWLIKTDSSGTIEWNQTIGGTGYDVAYSVVQTGDGGYAMAGVTRGPSGSLDMWLVKSNSTGDKLWERTWGGASMEKAFSVIQTSDGGFAVCGDTYSFGPGGDDFWLIKTNSSGYAQWNETYGGTSMHL